MAVKIRLKRTGRHGLALYRIVAADSRYPRDGRFLDVVGTYNPNTKPATCEINEEVALKWLSVGAQPTDTVKTLLTNAGIMKKFQESSITRISRICCYYTIKSQSMSTCSFKSNFNCHTIPLHLR